MHPKVIQAYSRAGFDPSDYMSTEDRVFQEFKRRTQGSDIERRIDQVYRVKHGTRDYIVYNMTEVGRDLPGNEVTASHMEGVYEKPEFKRTYNQRTGQVEAQSLTKRTKVYEIPFSKRNLERILKSATIDSSPAFTLDVGYTKFGGFTAQEFLTRSFEDLYEKATTGRLPEQARPLPDDNEVDKEMRAARKREEAELKKPIATGRKEPGEDFATRELALDEEDEGEVDEETARAYGAVEDEEKQPAESGRDLIDRADRRKSAKGKRGRRG